MAKVISWGDVPGSSGNSGGNKSVDFIKIKSGEKYTLRPVGPVISFGRYFIKDGTVSRMAICEDPSSCPVYLDHKDSDNMKPAALRYASFFIDRADNLLHIIDMPYTLARGIGARKEIDGKDPGSLRDGSDFVVRRIDNKIKGGKTQTKYEAHFVNYTPLTESERKMILDFCGGEIKNLKSKLQERFKIDSPAEIERKLFGSLEQDSGEDEGYSDNKPVAKEKYRKPEPVSEPEEKEKDNGDEMEETAW